MGLSYYQIVKDKHKAIGQRSFKTRLELYLFYLCINSQLKDGFFEGDFLSFQLTDDLIDLYELSWQVGEINYKANTWACELLDSQIIQWHFENLSIKDECYKKYENKFRSHILPLESFMNVFPEDPKKRICHYTGLSDYDFELLRKSGLIKTKNARGRYMEIDRLNSNKEYEKNNIVLACYWANNAKTDEFLYPEFVEYVGPAMRQVFLNRLKKINVN